MKGRKENHVTNVAFLLFSAWTMATKCYPILAIGETWLGNFLVFEKWMLFFQGSQRLKLLNVVSLSIQVLLTMELIMTFLSHIESKNCKETNYFLQTFFLSYLSMELLKLMCP